MPPLFEQFITEALKWKDTPWVDGGRSERGIDCLGLIVMAARGCGLDVKDHPELKSRPGMQSLVKAAGIYCDEIPVSQMRRGTLLLAHIRGEKEARHILIYDGYAVIHCGMHWQKVVHHRMNAKLRQSVKRAWVFKGELTCPEV